MQSFPSREHIMFTASSEQVFPIINKLLNCVSTAVNCTENDMDQTVPESNGTTMAKFDFSKI